MNNRDSFQITIKQGMEHHSNSMNIYDKKDFFYNSYQQAAYAITKIVEISNSEVKKENFQQDFEYHNNIVSFCADRGQGKTSAMLSMASALKKVPEEKSNEQTINFWNNQYRVKENNPVLNTRFECLSTIEPTRLEKDVSVLRTVISKMYKSASDKWKRNASYSFSMSDNVKQKQKELLADKFLTCMKGLDYLYKEKKEVASYYDDLNMAAEYGDSNNFKFELIELINLYLKFMSSDEENSMLVILIDDVDLNTERAYSIAEEIRKYFVIPRVIILMALHIGTLSRSIEQNQLQQYKVLLDYSSDSSIKERCCRAMERYISKLLPSSHRIYLPSISDVIEQDCNKINLSYEDENENDILAGYTYLKGKNFKDNYENRLFLLIYVKTGIILTKQNNYLHEFLPNNFRQLNHFLFYMNSMEDLFSKEKPEHLFESILKDPQGELPKLRLWQQNLALFQNYFLNSWCPERLPKQQSDVIRDTIHKSPSSIKNFITVKQIEVLISESSSQKTYDDIREQPTKNSGYTPFSDVIWALRCLKHSAVNLIKYLGFIYAIKMYYTIYIHTIALQGMWDCFAGNGEVIVPFYHLFNVLGGRVFPLHHYVVKKLPLYLLEYRSPQTIEKNELGGIFLFLSKANKPCTVKDSTFPSNFDNNGIQLIENEETQSRFSDTHSNYVNHLFFQVDFRKDVFTATQKASSMKLSENFVFFDFLQPIMNLLKFDYWQFTDNTIPVECLYGALKLICNLDLQEVAYQQFFKVPYSNDSSNDLGESLNTFFDLAIKVYDPLIFQTQNSMIFSVDQKINTRWLNDTLRKILDGIMDIPGIQRIVKYGVGNGTELTDNVSALFLNESDKTFVVSQTGILPPPKDPLQALYGNL